MKTITIQEETWKSLNLLKLNYGFNSLDSLIISLIKLEGGKKCLKKSNKTD